MSYLYLASPYTDPDDRVRERRCRSAMEVTARLLRSGIHVYSPIVHCHELANRHRLPKNFEFWEAYNFAMLENANGIAILKLSGWEASIGVRGEITFAEEHSLPIKYIDYPLTMRDPL